MSAARSGALNFRAAKTEDQEAVQALIFEILKEYGLSADPTAIDADLFDLENYYRGGVFEVLIDIRGDVIGTLGLRRLSDAHCELRKMYLAKAHRGGGKGRAMLVRATTRARELGFTRMELETAHVLKEAIGLYKAHGFQPLEESSQSARCDMTFFLDL